MAKPILTTIILTKNNQDTIKKCIKGAKRIKNSQIIVVDDYSDDKTRTIARKEGAVVTRRKVAGNFAAQRNFALTKTKTNWALFLDSDEIIPPPLSHEIVRRLKKANKEKVKGFYLKRQDFFLGRPLKHGETANVKLLRLAQKNSRNKWRGRVHEEWEVEGETQTLKHPLAHYSHKNITELLSKINFYTSLRAEELRGQGKATNWPQIITYPLAKFFKNYFCLHGWRDGAPGAIFAISMSLHSFLVRAKLYMLTNKS